MDGLVPGIVPGPIPEAPIRLIIKKTSTLTRCIFAMSTSSRRPERERLPITTTTYLCPTSACHPFNRMGRTLGKQSLTEYCAHGCPSYLFVRARCTERLHDKGSCSADISLLPPVTHHLARTTPPTCPYTHAVMLAVCRTSTLGLVQQGAWEETHN